MSPRSPEPQWSRRLRDVGLLLLALGILVLVYVALLLSGR